MRETSANEDENSFEKERYHEAHCLGRIGMRSKPFRDPARDAVRFQVHAEAALGTSLLCFSGRREELAAVI